MNEIINNLPVFILLKGIKNDLKLQKSAITYFCNKIPETQI